VRAIAGFGGATYLGTYERGLERLDGEVRTPGVAA
jgi:hypothetical protein